MTNTVNTENIEKIVDELKNEIQLIDETLIHEVVGVAQALGQLKKALDKLDNCLDKREFEKASKLGYEDIASEFIFLQRTLGGLLSSYYEKDKIVQDVALKARVAYEIAEPFVTGQMESLIPLERSEKIRNKKADEALREFQKTGQYLDHEIVKVWLKTWGTDEEKPLSYFVEKSSKK